jgi:hypothetical protein
MKISRDQVTLATDEVAVRDRRQAAASARQAR